MVSAALWDSTEGNVCIWPHSVFHEPGPSPLSGQHVLLAQACGLYRPIQCTACVTGAVCSCFQPPLQNLSQVCHPVILIGAVTLLAPSQLLFQICVMACCLFVTSRAAGTQLINIFSSIIRQLQKQCWKCNLWVSLTSQKKTVTSWS